MEFAERIARQPPIPVRMTKTTVNRFAHALDDLGRAHGRRPERADRTDRGLQGGNAAFRDKRKPVFKGR